MPWSLILTVALKLIDLMLARSKKKELTKKQMIEFIKRHDSRVMDNVKIRKEYDDIRKRDFHNKG